MRDGLAAAQDNRPEGEKFTSSAADGTISGTHMNSGSRKVRILGKSNLCFVQSGQDWMLDALRAGDGSS
jgi:hypothetical protein